MAKDIFSFKFLEENCGLSKRKAKKYAALIEEIQNKMPNPYSEGNWITLDEVTNKHWKEFRHSHIRNSDAEEAISRDEKETDPGKTLRLEIEEETDLKSKNEEFDLESGSEEEEEESTSSENICFSARNTILKGPLWNLHLRKFSTDLDFYHGVIFNTRRTSLKTPEELILKGPQWIPDKPITTSLARYLIKRLKRINPDKVALVELETSRSLTYGELLAKAESLAVGLIWLGLQAGQVLAIISYNSLEAFLMFLASIMIGVVVTMIDSNLSVIGIGIRLRQTCPHLVFCETGKTQVKVVTAICNLTQALQQHIPYLVINSNSEPTSSEYFTFNQLLKKIDPEYPIPVPRTLDPDRPVLILFSDGDNAKGCLIGERAFTYSKWFVDAIMPEVFEKDTVTVMFTPPLFFSPLVKSLLNHWIDGHRIIFFRGPAPEASLIKALRKYEVFGWLTIRIPLLNLLQWPAKPRCPHLKLIAVAGTPLRLGSITRIYEEVFNKKVQIVQVYVATEVGGVSGNSFLMNKLGSVGKLYHNIHLKILEEGTGVPLGPNQEGEICLKAPIMMLGYYNDPEANNEAFDSEGFVRTGDLGYYDEMGFLYITDHVRDMIRWKNYIIVPSLVEAVLTEQPEIREAFVFGLYGKEDKELVTAAIILDKQFEDVDIMMLQKRVNDLLPYPRKIRGGIHVFTEFPRYTLGKPMKSPILEEVMNRLGMTNTII